VRSLIGLLLMLNISVAAKVSSKNPAMKRRIDAVIDSALREEKIVGSTMIVAQNGKIVYRRTAGFNDREAKKPLRQTDVFRLASMTKLIVSVAALALIDEGKLNLDDPVTTYLPEFRPELAVGRESHITLCQMLRHTFRMNYCFLEKRLGEFQCLKVSDWKDLTEEVFYSLKAGVKTFGRFIPDLTRKIKNCAGCRVNENNGLLKTKRKTIAFPIEKLGEIA